MFVSAGVITPAIFDFLNVDHVKLFQINQVRNSYSRVAATKIFVERSVFMHWINLSSYGP